MRVRAYLYHHGEVGAVLTPRAPPRIARETSAPFGIRQEMSRFDSWSEPVTLTRIVGSFETATSFTGTAEKGVNIMLFKGMIQDLILRFVANRVPRLVCVNPIDFQHSLIKVPETIGVSSHPGEWGIHFRTIVQERFH